MGPMSISTALSPERLPEAARIALEAIYRDVDSEVRSLGVGCWVRGDCCDFDRSDHRLFATSIEVLHVREKHPRPLGIEGKLCPFWKEGLCTERERRPLGCRTYFCDARHREPLQALHERCHVRLRRIAEAHGLRWSYEPFVTAVRRTPQHALDFER